VAQEKVKTVRAWTLQLPREVAEYEGPAQRFGGFAEVDLQHAAAKLGARITALEEYLAGVLPGVSQPATGPPDTPTATPLPAPGGAEGGPTPGSPGPSSPHEGPVS
jgi:hypothetical protein